MKEIEIIQIKCDNLLFGEISLKSLIDIALALGCLDDFEELFNKNQTPTSLFNSNNDKHRKRGTIK